MNNAQNFYDKITASPTLSLLIFIGFSILFRFLSFHFSVIDHDESTYMIIAGELNKGAKIYTDVIDTKPVGIFTIFSFIQLLFGKSIFALRLFSAVILAFSAYFLFKVCKQLTNNTTLSFFSGITFLIAFSAYRMGLSINTEVYFTLFSIIGLHLMLKAYSKRSIVLWFLAGFIIGLGFIIKPVVLAGFGAFGLYFLIQAYQNSSLKRIIPALLFSIVGFFIPFFLLHLYFWVELRFDDFYYATYEVVSNYPSTLSFFGASSFLLKFVLGFSPFVLLYILSFIKNKGNKRLKKLSLIWLLFVGIIVVLPGKDFKHYYLQLLLPLCMLVPYGVKNLIQRKNVLIQQKIVLGMIFVAFLIAVVNQSYFILQKDIPREIASDLELEISEEDFIWVDKKYHITYYLLDLSPPSKYVHPTLMFNHTQAFGINTEEEANTILNKQPKFIIHKNDNAFFLTHVRIQSEYEFFKQYDKTLVLKRK